MIQLLVTLLIGGATAPSAGASAAILHDSVRVFQVEMVDISPSEFAFEPAEVEVRHGDVIRFVQKGVMPHNVEFREIPGGARLGDLTMGPFLLAKEETYDIVIDERFIPGTYPFLCTPHEMLGMKGTLVVEAREARPTTDAPHERKP